MAEFRVKSCVTSKSNISTRSEICCSCVCGCHHKLLLQQSANIQKNILSQNNRYDNPVDHHTPKDNTRRFITPPPLKKSTLTNEDTTDALIGLSSSKRCVQEESQTSTDDEIVCLVEPAAPLYRSVNDELEHSRSSSAVVYSSSASYQLSGRVDSGNLDTSKDIHRISSIKEFTERGPSPVPHHLRTEICRTLKMDKNDKSIFVKFFSFHTCYDLIPTSAKLVVFDTRLLVKKAFFALVYNGVRAAPLWDSDQQRFVGMLTITDFIRMLRMFYAAGSKAEIERLEEDQLQTWRNKLNAKGIIWIDPNSSLLEAIKTLIYNKIHRLPVIDPHTGNVLYILTHKRILRFLFLYITDLPKPAYFWNTIDELKIGTYSDIEVGTNQTKVIEALDKFMEKRISALPIVDEQKRLVGIYAKFDVINLAAEKTYDDLDVTIEKANAHRNEWFEGVHTCKPTDTLFHVMNSIVQAEVHRLVVVDDESRVVGVVSLSDILSYLVIRCTEEKGGVVVVDREKKADSPTCSNTIEPPLSSSSVNKVQLSNDDQEPSMSVDDLNVKEMMMNRSSKKTEDTLSNISLSGSIGAGTFTHDTS